MNKSGELLIDTLDAYTSFGVYVTSGGWAAFAAWPALKKIDSNDWQEEDGIEPDLADPVLDTRELTVTFAVGNTVSEESTNGNRYTDLLNLLMDGGYHTFDCALIGRSYRLRLASHPKLDFSRRLTTFSLKFSDDFPLDGYEYLEPESGMNPLGDYLLDGRDLAEYGVRVLKGTLSEVIARPDVKPAMLRNIATVPGAIYDPETVTLKTKDVKLTCLMRARTLEELWRNWDALLYDLTRPDERVIGVEGLAQEYYGHYSKSTVSKLNPSGRVWLEFTVTLTLTDGFRDELLATEDGIPVCTEDENSEIDMHHSTL